MAHPDREGDCTVQIIISDDCLNSEKYRLEIGNVFEKQLRIQHRIVSKDEQPYVHNFIICLDSSRLESDVKRAVNGLHLHRPKNYCIIYLHHFEAHALSTSTINSYEIFKYNEYLNRFGSIIDCVYNSKLEIYNCGVNKQAVERIFRFLNRVRIHFSEPVSENLQNAVKHLWESKLGLHCEIDTEEDPLNAYSVKPVFVLFPTNDNQQCIIRFQNHGHHLEYDESEQMTLNLTENKRNEEFDCDVDSNTEKHIRLSLNRVKIHYNRACRTKYLAALDKYSCTCYTCEMGGGSSSVKKPMKKPWRDMSDIKFDKRSLEKLKEEIKDFKKAWPDDHMNIAVLGKLQAGKSSFINSVLSVYGGHVSTKAYAAPKAGGVTDTYSQYEADDSTSFRLCDTRGNEGDFGISETDFGNLIEGHIETGYKFKKKKRIKKDDKYFKVSPIFSDRMHCVCFVFDANKLTAHTEAEYKSVRTFLDTIAVTYDLRFVVLLTHMDQVCDLVSKDASKMYSSKTAMNLVHTTALRLEIDERHIVPVVNYSSQTDTSEHMNILVLLALREMLRKCYDLYNEHSKEKPPQRKLAVPPLQR